MKHFKATRSFTWPQIRYWLMVASLVILGSAAAIWGDSLPWEYLRPIAKDLGPAIFTAGILAGLVEPFFRNEFARDAFLAAFRYVLPPEFRDEVEKILRLSFICEKQVWSVTVEITKTQPDMVFVTTCFQRKLKNKTSSSQLYRGWYTVPDFKFPAGDSQIIDCQITNDKETKKFEKAKDNGHYIEATTEQLDVAPDHTVEVLGKATQYRRTRDSVCETFTTPAVNPEIHVIVPDELEYEVDFGTSGDVEKEKYTERHKLSGVYFPGQFMQVTWWPKKGGAAGQPAA
jgi:hypothetical protein